MTNKFLGLKALIILLIATKLSFASSYDYYKTVTSKTGSKAKAGHALLKIAGKPLRILNCPLQLIEEQLGGPESIIVGTQILLDFVKQSQEAEPDYDSVMDNCLDALDDFRSRESQGLISSRAINVVEEQELRKTLLAIDNENKRLVELILENINQDTLCYANRVAANVSIFFSASMGVQSMTCYTPLGRRFSLKGPTLGFGVGAGAALTVPNSSRLHNPPTIRLQLFNHGPRKYWHSADIVSTYAMLVGASDIVDVPPSVRGSSQEKIYKHDIRAALGFGSSVQVVNNFMRKKDREPFLAKLAEVIDLVDFVLSIPR